MNPAQIKENTQKYFSKYSESINTIMELAQDKLSLGLIILTIKTSDELRDSLVSDLQEMAVQNLQNQVDVLAIASDISKLISVEKIDTAKLKKSFSDLSATLKNFSKEAK